MRRDQRAAGRRVGGACVAETVEPRVLLSRGLAAPVVAPAGTIAVRPTPVAVLAGGPWATRPIKPLANATAPFTPAQIRHFYGLDALSLNGVVGDGTGQTIAIVDAYYQPNIRSDLATFDSKFGLPAPPSFSVVGQAGGPSPTGTYDFGWAVEISLDVEWVHAVAPGANLLLVESNTNDAGNLYAAVSYARAYPGVSVVSMSWGAPESPADPNYNGYFTTPAGHAGVTFVASTGDAGAAETDYPALSPNVLAVGGTSIVTSDSQAAYGSETAWGGGGGAVSAYEARPAYQATAGLTAYAGRATPDLSFEADQSTGVYIYDTSSPTTGGGYYQAGGTSLSAPCVGAMVAIADQFRAAAGLPTLDGATATLPRVYQLFGTATANAPTYAADFHDVVAGSNGNTAAAGYDLATGLGTPIANAFVPDLANVTAAATSAVAGQAFEDDNADNLFDGTDVPLAGTVLYLDQNNDGTRQATEPTATTSATGAFAFAGVAAGTSGSVRLLSTSLIGGIPSAADAFSPTVAGGTTTVNVGLFPTVYADARPADAWTLRTDPASIFNLQVLVGGVVRYSAPASLPTSLSFAFAGAGDGLTIDASNGNPIPSGGVAVSAAAPTDGDALAVVGSAGADAIAFAAGSVAVGGRTVSFANLPSLSADPGAGTDSLTVNAGVVAVPPAPAGGGVLARLFSTVAVAAGATLRFGTDADHDDRAVVSVPAAGLAVAGTLDLGGNDLIVRNGSAAAVSALLATGYAAGRWNGTGIASAAAAADPTHTTALGVMANTANGIPLYGVFDTLTAAAADVLVKYTYYGDATLSGEVDGLSYGQIDVGYARHLTGWANGDFNYDGKVDGSDYALIDNAFNLQSASL